jgi:hypothetical protein
LTGVKNWNKSTCKSTLHQNSKGHHPHCHENLKYNTVKPQIKGHAFLVLLHLAYIICGPDSTSVQLMYYFFQVSVSQFKDFLHFMYKTSILMHILDLGLALSFVPHQLTHASLAVFNVISHMIFDAAMGRPSLSCSAFFAVLCICYKCLPHVLVKKQFYCEFCCVSWFYEVIIIDITKVNSHFWFLFSKTPIHPHLRNKNPVPHTNVKQGFHCTCMHVHKPPPYHISNVWLYWLTLYHKGEVKEYCVHSLRLTPIPCSHLLRHSLLVWTISPHSSHPLTLYKSHHFPALPLQPWRWKQYNT